jgi:hypothetical protein
MRSDRRSLERAFARLDPALRHDLLVIMVMQAGERASAIGKLYANPQQVQVAELLMDLDGPVEK